MTLQEIREARERVGYKLPNESTCAYCKYAVNIDDGNGNWRLHCTYLKPVKFPVDDEGTCLHFEEDE